MKFLHTSDWHIGKSLKGRSRLEEQTRVLRELAELVRTHEVDAVLVAGDLYESTTPSSEAQEWVVRALMSFRESGAEVIAMAGNHDSASTFDAYRPLMNAAGIRLVGSVRTAENGGLVSFQARSTGEKINVAVLPFLSQRYASRAAEVVAGTPADDTARYDQKVRDILASLCKGFTPDAVNLVMAHLTVTGGKMGGGERNAQSIFEYHVPAAAFPAEAHYVALGHLHRRQHIPAPCPVHYCGSPINVDFGEEDNQSYALLVEATPTTPASITELPITSAVQLRTVKGTVAELREGARSYGGALLRVIVDEPTRAGLREDVQGFLPNALEIRIAPEHQVVAGGAGPSSSLLDKSPSEILGSYLTEQRVNDPRLPTLFRLLHDGVEEGTPADVLSSAALPPEPGPQGPAAPTESLEASEAVS